jgi:hypothetical protein
MVVLQEEKEIWQQQLISFRVDKSEIEPIKKALESKGVSVHGACEPKMDAGSFSLFYRSQWPCT